MISLSDVARRPIFGLAGNDLIFEQPAAAINWRAMKATTSISSMTAMRNFRVSGRGRGVRLYQGQLYATAGTDVEAMAADDAASTSGSS